MIRPAPVTRRTFTSPSQRTEGVPGCHPMFVSRARVRTSTIATGSFFFRAPGSIMETSTETTKDSFLTAASPIPSGQTAAASLTRAPAARRTLAWRRSSAPPCHNTSCQWSVVRCQSPVVTEDLQPRSEEHTSELQSHSDVVCRLLLEKKKRQPSGAGGAKGGDQGECGPPKHVTGTQPDKRVTGALTHTSICSHTQKVNEIDRKANSQL